MILEWLTHLYTIRFGSYFVAGFFTAWFWQMLKAAIRKEPLVRVKWNYVAYVAATAVFLWSVTQTYQNTQCNHQFNAALRARAAISDDDAKWALAKQNAIGGWLHDVVSPPPEIAALRATDPYNPRITQWALTMSAHYNDIIQQATKEQDENLRERTRHPLPQPSCGA